MILPLTLILLIVQSAAGGVAFTANQKYAYVGTNSSILGKTTVDIASSITAVNSTNWFSNYPIFTIPYPLNYYSSSLLYGYTIGDLNIENIQYGVSVLVV